MTVDPSVAEPARLLSPWRRWRNRSAGPLVLLGLSCLLVALHVAHYPTLSPVDELQHIDYLYKSPHIVAAGEQIGQQAMHAEACRGLDAPPTVLPACSQDSTYRPADFQEGGYNTAAINTPTYYTLTHGLASLLQHLTGASSLVGPARLIGGLWLGLGLMIAFAAGRRLGYGRVPLTAALALLPAAPAVLFFSATVTPDAMTIGIGAAAVWSALYFEQRPARRWPVLVAVAAFAMLVKQTNVIVLGAVAVFLLLRWRAAARLDRRPAHVDRGTNPGTWTPARWYPIGLGLLAASVLVVFTGWQIISSRVAIPVVTPMSAGFVVGTFPWAGLLGGVGGLIDIAASTISLPGAFDAANVVQRGVRLVGIAGLIGMAVFRLPSSRAGAGRAVAQGALVVAVVGAPVLIVLNYLASSSYFVIPERYGYSLLPAMLLSAAGLARTRYATAVLCGVAVTLVMTAGLRLLLAG